MRKIAWLHIPKCGTSFLTVLLHFANRSLPPDAVVPGCRRNGLLRFPESDRVAKPDEHCVAHSAERTFFLRFPVRDWFADTFWNTPRDIGAHRALAEDVLREYDVFTMIRHPSRRIESAYQWFRSEFRFPISQEEYFIRSRGTMVKMIAGQADGYSCNAGYGKCKMSVRPNTPLAIHRLKQFKFVGLTVLLERAQR